MEMIERVARAILAAHDHTTNDGAIGGFETMTPDWQECYRGMALAAIEALRVPTEAMEFAGHEPIETSTGYVDGQLYWDAEGPYHVWQAMIDAALKP